jgi:hypothetical protein
VREGYSWQRRGRRMAALATNRSDGPGLRVDNVAVWSTEVQALAREPELARRRALHFDSGAVCM